MLGFVYSALSSLTSKCTVKKIISPVLLIMCDLSLLKVLKLQVNNYNFFHQNDCFSKLLTACMRRLLILPRRIVARTKGNSVSSMPIFRLQHIEGVNWSLVV